MNNTAKKVLAVCLCVATLLALLCGCAATPEGVTIPDLTGTDVDSAKAILTGKGLIPVVQKTEDDTVEVDAVVRTDPAAGEKAQPDSSVTIYVSTGAALKVPSLDGMSEEYAVATLEGMGLSVKTEYQNDEITDKGMIIHTTPSANVAVKKGDSVTIYVSLGSSTVYSEYAYLTWKNQGSGQDVWEFNNPSRDSDYLNLYCTSVTIYKNFEWQDRYENGFGGGIACLNDTFDKTVPVKIWYENVAVKSGEPFSMHIEIPLKELDTENPTDLHLKLYTCNYHTDTNTETIDLDLSISW